MKIVSNGNLVWWIRWALALAGICIICLSAYFIDDQNIRWAAIVIGLFIGSIGGYSAQAHMLGLRPFGKAPWQKAKETYEEPTNDADKSDHSSSIDREPR